jgi:CheY-like chemotaxis protein
MPAKILPKRSRLRLVLFNDSAPVLKMLCEWLQEHGHECHTALLADMRQAQDDVGRFIQKHRPDVVIYDVRMPYSSSWDLLDVIRTAPALHSQPFVITTPNKRNLEQAVGPTSAFEIGGPDSDLRRVLNAVIAAAAGGGLGS